MSDRARSVSGGRGNKSASSNRSKTPPTRGSGSTSGLSRQQSVSPSRRAGSSSKSPAGRKSSSRSPDRKSVGSRGKSRDATGKSRDGTGKASAASGRNVPKSARSNTSKGSMRSNKSRDDKMEEQGVSKSCGGITGMRVLAMKPSIEEKALNTVDMSGQGLTFAPTTTFIKNDVGIIDFSSNNIRGIPPEIKKLTNLVQLNLSKNGIRCLHPNDYGGLPNELSTLPNLEIIIISECNLPFIPPAIWKCKNLKILDISRNKINILVPEVGNLEQLRHLNAQQTNIGTLPPEIAFCQELEELLLWGNAIESLPETMREMPKLKSMPINFRSFCTMVDNYMDNLLKKGQIQSEHIPPVIFEMPGLEILDLGDTKINALPEKCLAQLQELYLQNNYFQKLPEMIISLEYLSILDISGNAMIELPDMLSSLKYLAILRADDNKFRQITPAIGQLTQLVELSLGGNQLQVLPDGIGKLTKLKTLILDRNQLNCLPETIVELTELSTLDLTENCLAALPINFYKMKNLRTAHTYLKIHKHGLWLHKNPLKVPPREVWNTEQPESIYSYMKKLQIQKTENLNRQKLIFLGESQCGKTSLMHTMVTGKSFLTRENTDSTRVVDFRAWRTENDVDFLITDLGGAEVYQNTHHLFLDPQAMYLLVYDHRKYTTQGHNSMIGLWLDLLYMLAPGAVVKLVGTQCDHLYPEMSGQVAEQVAGQVEEQQARYRDRISAEIHNIQANMKNTDGKLSTNQIQVLKEQLFRLMRLKQNPLRIEGDIAQVTSNEGIAGIQELIQNIEIMAVNRELFPNGQREIPRQWEAFRMALKREKAYCLQLNQLQKKAHELDVSLTECLHYLRDIGDILWYDHIPQLKNMVFYRPRSLVLTLQGLFNHDMAHFLTYEENRVFSSKGGLDRRLFDQATEQFTSYGEISRGLLMCLWFYQNLNYDAFNALVELVPKFDFCYTIPQAEIPLHKYDYQPLMVIPCFNGDCQPEDVTGYWAEEADAAELTVTLTFPVCYPSGLFERIGCRLQNHTLSRTDWRDLIIAQLDIGGEEEDDDTQLKLWRGLDMETYHSVLGIKVRGKTLEAAKCGVSIVHGEFQSLIAGYAGLVWYTGLRSQNCSGNIDECFPKNVFTSTVNVMRL